MAKGNDGCLLFRDRADYSKFTHLLNDSREKDPHVLLSYCLMPNHVHLLMETSAVSLSKIMHRLLLRYSLYFNKIYTRSGHLFQNRFKAKPCRQENYLLQLLVYIHENTRKAGLVSGMTTYPFSSERTYQKIVGANAPVNSSRALTLIGPSPEVAWRAYHHCLACVRQEEGKPRDSGISLNAEPSFSREQGIYLDENPCVNSSASRENVFDFLTNVPLDQICLTFAKAAGVDAMAIRANGRERAVSRARGLFITLARNAGWRPVDIMNEFGFHPGTIVYHTDHQEHFFQTETGHRLLCDLKQLLKVKRRGKREIPIFGFAG